MSEVIAVVIGSTGGIGAALIDTLNQRQIERETQPQTDRETSETSSIVHRLRFDRVVGVSRRQSVQSLPTIDITDEQSIERCARGLADLGTIRLVINATGLLHNERVKPEKSLRDLNAAQMAELFAINSIGPALLMKYFLPLLPRDGRSVFATLSAKVGSIGDNQLGGWYSYRAAKAAQNQLVRTAAIELKRRAPEAICVALHPGTVDTGLSASFAKAGLDVQTPAQSAAQLIEVIDHLTAAQSGGFFNYKAEALPW
jgi:NAD(P)-dependent dehydrogenase (short-subunit alcohol dehydrogenase family)